MNDGPPQDAPAPGTTSAADDGAEERDDAVLAQIAHLRRALARSVTETAERVQETVEDAVRRGRMTRKDAHELAAAIVAASRRQTDEIRQELEALLERGRRGLRKDPGAEGGSEAGVGAGGRSEVGGGAKAGGGAGSRTPVVIPIEREDGGERALPIERYDDLTALLVRKSLKGLSPEELRAVREHEASHAKRKTVLAEVDRLLRP